MKLNIEIDLASIGFEQDPETGDMYPTADMITRVAEIIAARVTNYDIRSAVESEVRNVAREHAGAIVSDVLSGPIRKTDSYGNVRETTTVPEMVMAALDEWMRLPKADSYRNPSMGDALRKMVDDLVRSELKGTVDAAKKKVSEEVLRLAVEGAANALASARVV